MFNYFTKSALFVLLLLLAGQGLLAQTYNGDNPGARIPIRFDSQIQL